MRTTLLTALGRLATLFISKAHQIILCFITNLTFGRLIMPSNHVKLAKLISQALQLQSFNHGWHALTWFQSITVGLDYDRSTLASFSNGTWVQNSTSGGSKGRETSKPTRSKPYIRSNLQKKSVKYWHPDSAVYPCFSNVRVVGFPGLASNRRELEFEFSNPIMFFFF